MPPNDDALTILPLETIGTSTPWFISQLTAQGIQLHKRSSLALALERLNVFKQAALVGHTFKFSTIDDAYAFFAEAIGADFLTKTIHRGVDAGLVLGQDRWRYFAAGDPIVTKASPIDSRERNLTWELVLASVMATFASNVRFDEPDLLCDFRGATFAVAAKQVRSDKRLLDNVDKGVEQSQGRAEAAVVFVNVVNILPVVDLLRTSYRTDFKKAGNVRDWVLSWAHQWCERPEIHRLAEEIGRTVSKPIGVAFFMPVMLLLGEQPLPFFYTHMPVRWTAEGGPDFEFATAFLQACRGVLGFPGMTKPHTAP